LLTVFIESTSTAIISVVIQLISYTDFFCF